MMKRTVALLLLSTLLLTGCGSGKIEEAATTGHQEADIQTEEDETGAASETENEAELETEEVAEIETETELATEAEVDESGVFAMLPDMFTYSSGAGGWQTELYLNDDGTFIGVYSDSDMGYTGAEYPNGTRYICNFTGKFAEPQIVNEYTYTTSIEYIETELEPGQEYIQDGIRYVASGPAGLSNAGEILIYLPGTPYTEMSEDFMSWARDGLGPEDLRCYGIYNVEGMAGFIGYNYLKFSELSKLAGRFQNESGDEICISIYSDWDGFSDEIGMCDWTFADGTVEIGTVYRNAEGGFTINLSESRTCKFEITNNEEGKVEFTGDGAPVIRGTYVMVEGFES